ncbi:hypothetical protein GGS23DRAFT_548385 [Durotheca rogersii]|uniref:uncharacterized protein n=1 Tax=Durotheca rogersii TaxID=419775 RepID=UPI002220B4E5|nr:uncharacterized protein GGS23DRAFT_548385 [Durotheca rogersii]KAI5867429.1 hypothetical protein GGS23DRAFT_548385 [Durotheca rogersii]
MWSFGTTMTMANDREPSPAASLPSRSSPPPQSVQHPMSPSRPRPSLLSQRSLKQLGLLFAGAGFLALSTLITRRAVARKRKITTPPFYQQSNRPVSTMASDGSVIAIEAMSLATLNVMSFAIMLTGGFSWAFDVSNLDDLRRLARRHVGPPGGQTDEESEREVEEWVARVLLRKEQKAKEARSSKQDDE